MGFEPTVRYERTQAFQAFSLGPRSRRDVLFHSADRVIGRDRNSQMSYFAALNPDSNPDCRVRFVIHKVHRDLRGGVRVAIIRSCHFEAVILIDRQADYALEQRVGIRVIHGVGVHVAEYVLDCDEDAFGH